MSRRTARLFKNGGSQAVRLPKEFRLEGEEVFVRMEGDTIILSPKPKSWKNFFDKTPLPSEDFMQERVDLPPQRRKGVS
jgi:antitoxin VapB